MAPHVFSAVTVTFFPFFFLCVIWKKGNSYKIWPNKRKTFFFTKSCMVSNTEQVLLITFLWKTNHCKTYLLSDVVLPKLCGAISCIIQSLKSLFLPKSNWCTIKANCQQQGKQSFWDCSSNFILFERKQEQRWLSLQVRPCIFRSFPGGWLDLHRHSSGFLSHCKAI